MWIVSTIFFLCGFATAFQGVLIPFLQDVLQLTYSKIITVQISFYMGYFIFSPITGVWLQNQPYVKGIRTGLQVSMIGAGLISFGGYLESYIFILIAIFLLGSGIAILQVSTNPYVIKMGETQSASSRLNIAQASTSIGMVLAPSLGSICLLDDTVMDSCSPLERPYIWLSVCWGILYLYSLRKLKKDEPNASKGVLTLDKKLFMGFCVLALAVGAEATVASFMIKYIAIRTVSTSYAAQLSSFFWLGLALGRIVGGFALTRYSPSLVMSVHALFGMSLSLLATFTSGIISVVFVLMMGYAISIFFPTIFSIVLSSKTNCPEISGILCMGNIGGAIIPLIQGGIADLTESLSLSYMAPGFCFLFLLLFAITQKQNQSYQQPREKPQKIGMQP